MPIQEQPQENRIEQVNITNPNPSELHRIIEAQVEHGGRSVTCMRRFSEDTETHNTLNLQDRQRVHQILQLLEQLEFDAITLHQIIIYDSSAKD